MSDRKLGGSQEVVNILDCLATIERNISKIEEINSNGGLEEIDTEEVERWQKKALTVRLEKSKHA
jgi:hypothetical protein